MVFEAKEGDASVVDYKFVVVAKLVTNQPIKFNVSLTLWPPSSD